MRYAIVLSFLMALLFPAGARAATCPNVGVHPGITTIFLQTDFGEKDTATKIYVTGMKDAIKKSTAYCLVEDPRAAEFTLDLSGLDLAEEHDRAAVSVILISEKGSLLSHWIRLSSIDNVEKNSQEDLLKTDRAIQRSKRRH